MCIISEDVHNWSTIICNTEEGKNGLLFLKYFTGEQLVFTKRATRQGLFADALRGGCFSERVTGVWSFKVPF